MKKKHHILIGPLRTGRFRFLLAAIVSVFVLRPFLDSVAGISFLTDIFLALVTVSGIFGLAEERRKFLGALVIAFAVFALQVTSHLFHTFPMEVLKRICYAVFFAYLLIIILSHIFRQEEVTEDLITGAVCAYLLIGLVWTFIFYFLEQARQGSCFPCHKLTSRYRVILLLQFRNPFNAGIWGHCSPNESCPLLQRS